MADLKASFTYKTSITFRLIALLSSLAVVMLVPSSPPIQIGAMLLVWMINGIIYNGWKFSIAFIDEMVSWITAVSVSTIIVGMVLLAFLQVILRDFFNTGIMWADVVLRHMVLWTGMLGGVLATRQMRHIGIDLFPRLVGKTLKKVISISGNIFVLVVAYYLMRASASFVEVERQFRSMLFNDIPSWWGEIILPIGFGMIALQMVLNILLGRFKEYETVPVREISTISAQSGEGIE